MRLDANNETTYILTADIGGSHITSSVVNVEQKSIVENTIFHSTVNSQGTADEILATWLNALASSLEKCNDIKISGVSIAMPGPFDYNKGICLMENVGKYDSIYGYNIKLAVYEKLYQHLPSAENVVFLNDADAFILGAVYQQNWETDKVIGITLGTGYGSGFVENGQLRTSGKDIPKDGLLYCQPYKEGINEDYISTRWFVNEWNKKTGESIKGVKEVAESQEALSNDLFEEFGQNLSNTLLPWRTSFNPSKLIIGGNITKALSRFENTLNKDLNINEIIAYPSTEEASMIGAAIHFTKTISNKMTRNTKQYLMPSKVEGTEKGQYNIYPSHQLTEGEINIGYASLAQSIKGNNKILLDGFVGVDWEAVTSQLLDALKAEGIQKATFLNLDGALKSDKEIEELVAPYLGGDDPIFGKIYDKNLVDFFDQEKLDQLKNQEGELVIIYGSGASLLQDSDTALVYFDVPKNEIQFRSRASRVLNLGAREIVAPKPQYKRMYFVDWMILNDQKSKILKDIDFIVDEQRSNEITWTDGDTFRKGLEDMSQNAFRVRPWFEPGAWGGQWIKDKIGGLNDDVPNYAWSFELIVPENGIVFEQNGNLLEVSFDFLMFHNHHNVLGEAANRFGYEFPIRFDFLDTYDGGNLSVQCHPRVPYMQEHFGHKFTQDETYYMLDAEEDAKVYLGFQEDIEPKAFENALTHAMESGEEMDVEKYVQVHKANKHDLFLIPNGTIHCSGKNGMVLEISSTPYIFTFKMYDWQRLDLDGKPRPMNIERGMENLYFDRKGDKVQEELISKQVVTEEGEDYQIVNLSTHKEHFYAVDRFEFDSSIEVELNNQCHIMSLVEGESITVVTNEKTFDINYAETFVVPAASKHYKLINTSGKRVKVIKSYVKSEEC
ncbi:ROK family protein [Flammeovirga yaeyamensis]|uniref:ROK family protein n=1 Tax=Flammeovirga yaeyamensis TaxID=367791 RepID=A0AAX1NBX1_9BACT|nr:ROK family protein [Flammeovirga yaeyamensis]MBB3701342.1 putative NBD/HSP70 family sugar kinase/mannose-6-phosphate isomerase class I [Flammeovirga yaeyamensis]NMF38590.1 ROK family protein [Flammeovirga yaeyamensis]QWG04446.1 ROK family protein [Flammeovirga yaeyamensis]